MGNIDLAYFAGFFDADGCISLSKSRQEDCKQGYKFRLTIEVCQKARSVLHDFQENWGGGIYPGHRADRWYLYGDKAARFLQDILPYLRLKAREARLAIKLQRAKLAWRKRRTGRTDVECQQEGEYHSLMIDLKAMRN